MRAFTQSRETHDLRKRIKFKKSQILEAARTRCQFEWIELNALIFPFIVELLMHIIMQQITDLHSNWNASKSLPKQWINWIK